MSKKKWSIRLALPVLALIYTAARSQEPASMTERFRQMSADAEARGLAEPFKGITALGTVEPGLFPVRSTGVSTEPVRKAASAFLAALTPEQRKNSQFAVDDVEWRKWMNQDFYLRQGSGFIDMTDSQKEAAFGLMRASLSAKGMRLSRDIMKLNYTLGELNNNDFVRYGEWRYWITVMGEPSAGKPWGWQLDGHHLILNYFVLGDQVVMTPVFLGSEPVIATSGKYKGTSILEEEQSQGLKLIQSLDEAQRRKAILDSEKTGNHNLAEAFKDNIVLDYAGVPVSTFTAPQKESLMQLAGLYIANLDDGHAKVKLDDVRQRLDKTYFAWIGGTGEKSVYYYRIHSPVILIEFDHQRPVGLRHLFTGPPVPNREHIHT
ncbi:MAG: DUF3500 domain-containing protein, partial [Bryobacterales bacterium]|nr:DUF3500 domain-containing protein [Bryobacterales bacterium]